MLKPIRRRHLFSISKPPRFESTRFSGSSDSRRWVAVPALRPSDTQLAGNPQQVLTPASTPAGSALPSPCLRPGAGVGRSPEPRQGRQDRGVGRGGGEAPFRIVPRPRRIPSGDQPRRPWRLHNCDDVTSGGPGRAGRGPGSAGPRDSACGPRPTMLLYRSAAWFAKGLREYTK